MSNRLLIKLSLRALILAPLAVSCSTPSTVQYTGPWLRPSPALKERIDNNARRLPWTHGVERVELVRWFSELGEPAYPALLELCQDPRPDVSGAALGALCATGDSSLVPTLQALPWPNEDRIDLRLERARALLRLGDLSMAPHLIEGLKHERLYVRALCAQSLYEVTKDRFGYEPGDSSDARELAIGRWHEWWASRSQVTERLARADFGAQ